MDNNALYSLKASTLSFLASYAAIPVLARKMLSSGHSGMDLNKKPRKQIPESLGIITAICTILSCFGLKYYCSIGTDFKLKMAAILYYSTFSTVLGVWDDFFGVRWRNKILYPLIASIPLSVFYYFSNESTSLQIPKIIQPLLSLSSINFGILFYIYIGFIIVFCTNSINIYAGINGLETGQTLIISFSVMCFGFFRDYFFEKKHPGNLFATYTLAPFFSAVLALYIFNKYPSKVFVGDTFTLFAGSYIALCCIFAGFGEFLVFFFVPQLINFVYSLPQLLHFYGYKCPPHRVPIYNVKTGKLKASENLTLINLVLRKFGEMKEDRLCIVLLLIQTGCCFFFPSMLLLLGF